jgi:hypothetical protein
MGKAKGRGRPGAASKAAIARNVCAALHALVTKGSRTNSEDININAIYYA